MSRDDSETDEYELWTRRETLQAGGAGAAAMAAYPASHAGGDGGQGFLASVKNRLTGDPDLVVMHNGEVVTEDPKELNFEGTAIKEVTEVNDYDGLVRITLEGGSGGGAFADTNGDGVAELQDNHTDFKGGDVRNTGNFNDAIVAYPGHKTIQQAFDEAIDGDTVIIAGKHTEHSIQMVDTEMDVYWWGSVENTATDGSHTFIHPSTLGVMRQRWFQPEIIGNSSSGAGIVCEGDIGSGDTSANSPNQFALIDPVIRDHGGYGIWWAAPVGCYIGGHVSGARIRNNGDSEGTAKTNIRIERGAVNCAIEGTFLEQTGAAPARNLWWTDPNGCVARNIDHYSTEYGMYIEGAFNLQIDGFHWFENSAATADIHWGTSANHGIADMQSRQSVQTGVVKWINGVELEATAGIGKTIRWEDPQILNNTNNVAETYVQGFIPEQSTDPAYALYDDTYMYVRSDLATPELRILDSSGTNTAIALDGTTK